MPKKSLAAQARHDETKKVLEAELQKYQEIARQLRTSSESTLVKTHKQREYHAKILQIQSQLEKHSI
jgi:hypothetical protein